MKRNQTEEEREVSDREEENGMERWSQEKEENKVGVEPKGGREGSECKRGG